jgi:hypothetical protein
MPYEIFWYVDKRVIGTRYYGEVTVEEIRANGEDVKKFVQEVTVHPLFYVSDSLDITKFPTNMKDLVKALRGSGSGGGNIQWTLMVSGNRFINFIGAFVSNFFNTPIRTFRTMEEAEAFIKHHAPDLIPALEARAKGRLAEAS